MDLPTPLINKFPSDLSHLIHGFILRPDWRTCRVHESQLIKQFNLWTNRVLNDDALDWYDPDFKLEFPIVFSQKELDIYLKEWTLVGRWYLIQRTKRDYYWHLYRNNTDSYYACAFDEIHNAWRKR